jgi:hypothetical protein
VVIYQVKLLIMVQVQFSTNRYIADVHSLEQAENIKFTLEQQMLFFARLVGQFKVADDITPIKIENFD